MWGDYFRYPAIRAPVLFLVGEDDNVTPYTFVEEQLGRLLADGIDASGHRFPRVPARIASACWGCSGERTSRYGKTR